MSTFPAASDPRRHIKNAYLIVCPKEGERQAVATQFLLNLLCTRASACGTCASCRKVLSGAHPDIYAVRTPHTSIKVDEIRRVLSFIADKSFEGGYKAVVIEQAERMTPEAQNCLLKPVEEPPADTVFLLTARSESTILPTVASRCERIRVRPLPADALLEKLLAETNAPEMKARLACALSDGYPHEAMRLLHDDAFFALREETVALCARLCAARHMGIQRYVDFFEAHKNEAMTILQVMLSYFFDLLTVRLTGSADGVKNIDRRKEIADFSVHFTRAGLRTMIECICETEKRLRFALNYRLAVENMLFGILEGKHRGESNRRPV